MEQWKKGQQYEQMLNRRAIRRAEAMREIESARCDRSVNLNLSSKGLTSLPDSIGNLTNLTTLRLCRNQLVELPTSSIRYSK
jgi:Leucine-rich repeat (LRR) protein